jgi:hypothetical protein
MRIAGGAFKYVAICRDFSGAKASVDRGPRQLPSTTPARATSHKPYDKQ